MTSTGSGFALTLLFALSCCRPAFAVLLPAGALSAPDATRHALASGCGTPLSPEDAERALALENLGMYRSDHHSMTGPWQVRTAIHIVRTDQGAGGLTEDALANSLQKANQDLLPANITLIPWGGIDYIDSDAFYYEIDTTAEINQLRSTNPVEHALNIYFTENLANEQGPFCGLSSFSWHTYQGVVMMNACVPSSWNPSTFTHELGHYFDLLHTHETAYGLECVDGSNCSAAGDRLCDTPADPRLNRCGTSGTEYCVTSSCQYTGTFTDPCQADIYDPATDNMMSYSRPLCRTSFTPQQLSKAEATLVNIRSDHILDPTGLASDSHIDREREWGTLGPPVPNPSSGRVTCDLTLLGRATARVRVYDAAGRISATLLDHPLEAGARRLIWDPSSALPSGIYFIRLDAGDARETRVVVRAR